ncbi:hypothetical protein FE257_011055 [Aspergillus nanangensis]|uniref:DUF605-domain-containing protein n=1 Tax=Aspergillus nanangensis TaxID=2582783 RepID=A0AAD4CIG9_ASPNN|nr:hypothetical protein FE257_011055 [Aspergillus nanangensis]
MASDIPAGLRAADIGRFAVRAAQLEKARPVVAYWCNFYIVNQIIQKGLHVSDDEVNLYTTNLVVKLEQFKNENPENDAVTDAIAASAYVEQFALEVFGRAEATMRVNKVTRQTADTFQAAATFLEVLQNWNPPDPEIAAKIKFAKYHALRIAKALKAGEDPNASNPVVKEEEDDLNPTDNDPEVQAIVGSASQDAVRSRQPSVEEVPDDATQSSLSLPAQPQTPPSQDIPSHDFAHTHGHYNDQDAPLTLPSAPETITSSSPSVPRLPDTPSDIGARHHNPAPSDPDSFQSFPPPVTMPSQSPPIMPPHDIREFYSASPPPGPAQPPSATVPTVPQHTHQPVPAPVARAPAAAAPSRANVQSADDQAIALAQKHARWAVSALAFDDVDTAIKELRNSLKQLGAE